MWPKGSQHESCQFEERPRSSGGARRADGLCYILTWYNILCYNLSYVIIIISYHIMIILYYTILLQRGAGRRHSLAATCSTRRQGAGGSSAVVVCLWSNVFVMISCMLVVFLLFFVRGLLRRSGAGVALARPSLGGTTCLTLLV